MNYEVLARKWRPQSFKELIGQDSVRTTLINSLKYNRLHPVLLFTGPRGTGKTSVARIFAKTLRCEKAKDFVPCSKCQDCTLIQEGKSLDVIEIDGASHNGVEAVRSLKETVNYMPTTGKYKIYIIDEVHMLSTAAFNALLKTLEEPPEHAFFIMATTESQKIPITVVSRSQKFDFYLIPQEALKTQLEKISKAEKIDIQDEALWLIVKQAQGSLRDGQGLLDKMITFCSGKITEEKVISILGLTERSLLLKALESIIKRDESQLLKLLHEIYTKGCDANLFIQDFIELLRNLILLKVNPSNKPSLVHASDQEIDKLKTFNKDLSYEEAHMLFDMSLKGEKEIALCHDNHLALEVLLLRLSQAPKLEEIAPFYAHKNSSTLKDKPSKNQTASLNTNNNSLESKWFEFINHLKLSQPRLSVLVECLSLKEWNQTQVHFILSDKYSFLIDQVISAKEKIGLEFNQFVQAEQSYSISITQSQENFKSLGDKKTEIDKEKLFKEVSTDPFVKKVNSIFKSKVKSLSAEDNK